MTTNRILEELYEIRREILAEHKDHPAEYLRAEIARTRSAGHPIAQIKQRAHRRAGAAKSDESTVT